MSHVPIVLYGASGRMGRAVRAAAAEVPGAEIVLQVARSAPDAITPAELVKRGGGAAPSDAVVIDVSLAAGAPVLLDWLEASPHALVSASTGLDPAVERRLEALARRAPVMRAPNLSLGSAVAVAMLRALPPGARDAFEMDVLEHHHAAKRDAPSGTALVWARTLGSQVDAHPDVTKPRAAGSVRVHSIRSGSVPGTHRAILAGAGETLEIVHAVTDRAVFARGAIRVARFLAGKPPGLYTLERVLEQT